MGSSGRAAAVCRWADIGLLALALPVFVAADFPLLGYAVAGGTWLVAAGIHLAAERHAMQALQRGNRRGALGPIAAATMARVWLVALAVLLVGVLAEREDGLAAALLALALFTVHLAGRGIARLFEPQGGPG
jgi:hypothetical protein